MIQKVTSLNPCITRRHWMNTFSHCFVAEFLLLFEKTLNKNKLLGGSHSSVVSSAPTICGPGFESQALQLHFFNL